MEEKYNKIIKDISAFVRSKQDDTREIIADYAMIGDHDSKARNNMVKIDNYLKILLADLDKIKGKTHYRKTTPPSKLHKSKLPKSELKTRINGVLFHESTASATFVKTLEYMGISDAQGIIDLKSNGNSFISQQKPIKNNSGYPSYEKCGLWYVITNFNNKNKGVILKKIAKRLGFKVTIEIS